MRAGKDRSHVGAHVVEWRATHASGERPKAAGDPVQPMRAGEVRPRTNNYRSNGSVTHASGERPGEYKCLNCLLLFAEFLHLLLY